MGVKKMRNKILFLGALLIIGIFVMGPVSATKLIDKGSNTVYSPKYDAYGDATWKAYEKNKYYVTVYTYAYYPTVSQTYKSKIIIKNVKHSRYSKLKFTSYINHNGKTTKSVKYYKSYGYTALKFYNSVLKYEFRNL